MGLLFLKQLATWHAGKPKNNVFQIQKTCQKQMFFYIFLGGFWAKESEKKCSAKSLLNTHFKVLAQYLDNEAAGL